MSTKIKICGITNLEDALAAVACGADYLGFIFAENSPRLVTRETVKQIVSALPEGVRTVGVFVDARASEVIDTLAYCGLDIAQLCGHESPQDAEAIEVGRVWKAFHLLSTADVEAAAAFPATAILADTMLPGQRGGTGRVCNWELAARLGETRRLVLAGGITADNIVEAAEAVKPAVIDIGSGVEAEPGRKDKIKLQTLFSFKDLL